MSKPASANLTTYITMKDVTARYGGVTPRAVRRWVEKEILPQADLTINGRQYWKPETLDANDRQRVVDAADKRPVGQFDGTRNKRGRKLTAAE